MKKTISSFFAVMMLCALVWAQPERIWVDKTTDIGKAYITDIAVREEGARFISTRNGLYAAAGQEEQWRSLFLLPLSGSQAITCFDVRGDIVLLGTTRGLYGSRDGGKSWKRIFYSLIPKRKSVACVDISETEENDIIVGTADGVFMSDDFGDTWRRIMKRSVSYASWYGDSIYVSVGQKLFSTDDGGVRWKQIFSTDTHLRRDGEEGFAKKDTGEENSVVEDGIAYFGIVDGIMHIAVGREVFFLPKGSDIWELFPGRGLKGKINDLLFGKSGRIYAATSEGAFEYFREADRWSEVDSEISSTEVKKLLFVPDSDGLLLAATSEGLYTLRDARPGEGLNSDAERKQKEKMLLLESGPDFIELQQAAIAYNEVHPDKIRSFRRASKLKALFPKISFGFDGRRSTNYEIYKSSTKNYIVAGPDDESRDWDISFSWELGDLIYSDDQTSIDVRSRLMVQLRNDILDDLRRAYYQRKRLLAEMALYPSDDRRIRLEKELRLQELTATIDGLTGNYLSDRQRKRLRASPSL